MEEYLVTYKYFLDIRLGKKISVFSQASIYDILTFWKILYTYAQKKRL
jgi:hypothetical protein